MTTTSSQAVASNAKAAGKTVEITPFHRDLFTAMETAHKEHGTMLTRMQALLKSKYGETMPTWMQAKGDRQALKALADERGLADDQWLRKPYNLAVKALYGALPESTSASAEAKRRMRDAGIKVTQVKAGAKKGETAPRRTGDPETLEQYITCIGVWKVLEQCCVILECDDSTKDVAEKVRADTKKAA